MVRQWINLCLALLTAGGFYAQQAADSTLLSREPTPGPDALSGSYSIVVEGYDWGPGVSRAVLELESEVDEVSPQQFLVTEEKQAREQSSADMFETGGGLTIARAQRTVTGAYLSDSQGNPTGQSSRYVTLNLGVAPGVGSPLCLNTDQQHYRWADPYRLVIELATGQSISSGGTQYTRLAVSRTPTGVELPLAGQFQTGQFSFEHQTFQYAHYAPQSDGQKHPLVIWLHGLGEGGSDPTIPLLGCRVTSLAEAQFQQTMGGAYVLVPQCPTMWMDDGSGRNTTDGTSCYTQGLMELVCGYVNSHPDIDPGRIYVGGCSNGGYMTLALLLEEPDYFAAAFPVCEAYQDSWLSGQDIQTLKDIPIWFVHSSLDQICPPDQSTFPTYRRLVEAGADNVHLSSFGQITDQSGLSAALNGAAYQYNPHYVWVRVLNGTCYDPATGTTLFQWLARQGR